MNRTVNKDHPFNQAKLHLTVYCPSVQLHTEAWWHRLAQRTVNKCQKTNKLHRHAAKLRVSRGNSNIQTVEGDICSLDAAMALLRYTDMLPFSLRDTSDFKKENEWVQLQSFVSKNILRFLICFYIKLCSCKFSNWEWGKLTYTSGRHWINYFIYFFFTYHSCVFKKNAEKL